MINGYDKLGNAETVAAIAGRSYRPVLLDAKSISVPPIITGPRGKAWAADLAACRREALVEGRLDDVRNDATVAALIIEAPFAHPVWHSYGLILIHLRPLLLPRETLFYLDNATHELVLSALDPKADREAMLTSYAAFGAARLMPDNFAAQGILKSDDDAITLIHSAIQLVVRGALSPDTDHIRDWASLFGDNMMKDRVDKRPAQRVLR
jgi:hypothetical protein